MLALMPLLTFAPAPAEQFEHKFSGTLSRAIRDLLASPALWWVGRSGFEKRYKCGLIGEFVSYLFNSVIQIQWKGGAFMSYALRNNIGRFTQCIIFLHSFPDACVKLFSSGVVLGRRLLLRHRG